MLTNIELFEFSKNNPEPLFDPFYEKGLLVIPESPRQINLLTSNNERLISLITSFDTIHTQYNQGFNNELIQNIILDIIDILDNTPNINYSAFVQFFMVYNSTYSIYNSLTTEQKTEFIYEMLKRYCAERHKMYFGHGYSNIVLQVVSDNYSHKRNSKTGIDKALNFLNTAQHPLTHLETTDNLLHQDDFYFLPDKGDRHLFDFMLNALSIEMKSRGIEHDKLPDMVFKHNEQYYICELKTMKGEGGGQNKQIVEIAYFIKFSEQNPNIHYIAFLDCDYSNKLFHNNSPKVIAQRNDIIKALQDNPSNYFLNTAGLVKFIDEIYTE